MNVIESDTGFSVEVLGHTGLCYREGERSLKVDSEVLMGSTGMVVDASSIRTWAPPHENEVIDAARRKQIVENIQAVFRFRGFEIDVA
ncbi:MAG TPA: Imm74 family immunity protein [Polyangiaceae bacterium]|nr:Imm74 family immunity protein [Polyangiaceae bacterium]